MVYNPSPIEVLRSATFDAWFSSLRDQQAMIRIAVRIDRLSFCNPGDIRPIGCGVSEMRVHYGPSYRIYLKQRGSTIALILCGGDKRSQVADIRRAIEIAESWEG
jgi:putative addiction module killer protein